MLKNTFCECGGGASSEGKWCGRKNGNGRSEVQRQYCTNVEEIKQLSLILRERCMKKKSKTKTNKC